MTLYKASLNGSVVRLKNKLIRNSMMGDSEDGRVNGQNEDKLSGDWMMTTIDFVWISWWRSWWWLWWWLSCLLVFLSLVISIAFWIQFELFPVCLSLVLIAFWFRWGKGLSINCLLHLYLSWQQSMAINCSMKDSLLFICQFSSWVLYQGLCLIMRSTLEDDLLQWNTNIDLMRELS